MKISARNKLQGTITAIEKGAVNSTARIAGGGGAVITSMITNEAVADLGLAEGETAYAIVEVSEVVVAAEQGNAALGPGRVRRYRGGEPTRIQRERNMDRRSFLRTTTVGAAGSAALAAPAIAQSSPQVQWRCTSSFPQALDTIYGGATDVAKYVRDATDGAFDIQVFAAGEIVPGLQAADAVQNGTVEMCHTAAYYYVGKSPTWALGAVIPYGLNNRGMNAWLYYGGGLDLLNQFYNGQGLVYLPAGNTGTQMGGWFRNEIGGLSDMQGLQMRIAGLAGQVMEAIGVVPQQIAGGDIYPALERGTIDAAEWIGPYDDLKLGFYQVAPYYYYPGWWEGNLTLNCFVNTSAWEELPAHYKRLLETACRAANTEMMAEYDYKNPAALRALVANGAQLRAYPPQVLDATYDASMSLYSDLRSSDQDWARIYDSMMAFQVEHFLWQQVAEANFAQYMQEKQRNGLLPAQMAGGQ